MTSSADFKQAIKSGKISEAFLVAMSNIPELQITTKIITDRPEGSNRSTSETDNYLQTHISLIEGKIENEIGEKFTGDRYGEIKQFHLEQVTQAHQTIQQNLISLQKMFQLMSASQQVAEHPNCVNLAADTSPALSTEPKPSPLQGNSTKVIKAKIAETSPEAATSALKSNNLEPQLPAFNYDSIDDLLSMADDGDLGSETEIVREDWSEWLDEEDEVKTTVFEFKTFKELQDKERQNQTLDKQERSPETTLVD